MTSDAVLVLLAARIETFLGSGIHISDVEWPTTARYQTANITWRSLIDPK
jgi:hypothetical protein